MQTTDLPAWYQARIVVLDTGCWEWRGSINPQGYGTVAANGTTVGAHRMTYCLLVGLIPEGFQVDHLCRVRHCVNPQHLEIVTVRENILRGIGQPAQNARKTVCVNGHALDEENTYVNTVAGNQWRECRACRRNQQAAAQERYRVARELLHPETKVPTTCCGQTFVHLAGLKSHRRKAVHMSAPR